MWWPRQSYPGWQRRTSKQDENDEQPHPVSYHPTAPRHHTVPHLHIPSTQSPRSLNKHTTRRKNETPGQENENEHENENEDEHGNDGQTTNTGTHGPARRQASNETHDETTNETPNNKTKDETRRKRQGAKIKHGRRGHEKQEEYNAPSSNLSPDPLPPSLSNPRAPNYSPRPPVGG